MRQRAWQVIIVVAGAKRDVETRTVLVCVFLGSTSVISALALQLLKITTLN